MKKLLLPLLIILIFAACKKEIAEENIQKDPEQTNAVAAKGPPAKIDVCHHDAATNTWHTINISINAWPDHQAHGDVRLDDQDDDGYVPNNACGFGTQGDCNDNNVAINPGAAEVCNGIDDNCNGQTDEGVQTTFYQDSDNDSYGNAAVTQTACTAPTGYVANDDDCNDNNAAINPGATEICNNGIDENCNGQIDENCLVIGQDYQGGKIAYILQPGNPGYVAGETHGLIAAASDQTSAEWGCHGTAITGADGTALGTGNQNTIDIMTGCAEAGIAARICGDLVLNGYSDWYLPSPDELNVMYLNRVAIGGFVNGIYWSSFEVTNLQAWYINFNNGGFSFTGKQNLFSVRAVRSF